MSQIFNINTQNRVEISDYKLLKANLNLEELFKQIFDIAKQQLDTIMKEEGNEDKFINQKEYLNEFSSVEYQEKNIRVRTNQGPAEEPANQGPKAFTHGKDDEDENEFKALKLEIEEQREICIK
jgi:hypothetical protein